MKIGIVILNYLAYQTTIETVDSFLKQDEDGHELLFVIVDNDSPNESYEKLCEEFSGNTMIKVIRTEKNLGFANGNNVGYQELVKYMDPDFVIISNDDIILPQPALYQWIINCYEKYQFAVLGPDVYSINGKFHQNPFPIATRSTKECKKDITNLKIMYLKCKIKSILHYTSYSGVPKWENLYYQEFHDDMTLHGSFQIFSSNYFKYYDLPYDSRTFLYREEDILRLRCEKNNLKCVYEPSYRIEHLQAVSTNMVHKEDNKKEMQRIKHLLDSTNVYLQVLNES